MFVLNDSLSGTTTQHIVAHSILESLVSLTWLVVLQTFEISFYKLGRVSTWKGLKDLETTSEVTSDWFRSLNEALQWNLRLEQKKT